MRRSVRRCASDTFAPSTVKAREQNRRLERDACDETVAHENEGRDVFNFVSFKYASAPQRWAPFLALFAVRAWKRHSLFEVGGDRLRPTKTARVRDETAVHQPSIENVSPTKIFLVDLALEPQHCLSRFILPNPLPSCVCHNYNWSASVLFQGQSGPSVTTWPSLERQMTPIMQMNHREALEQLSGCF